MNYFDRGYYTIEQWNDGKKLHYLGFSYNSNECPDDMSVEEWLVTDEGSVDFVYPCGVYLPTKNGIDMEELATQTELSHQYMERITESEAESYFNEFFEDDKPGTYLPMEKVNADTPCGDYWCYE